MRLTVGGWLGGRWRCALTEVGEARKGRFSKSGQRSMYRKTRRRLRVNIDSGPLTRLTSEPHFLRESGGHDKRRGRGSQAGALKG